MCCANSNIFAEKSKHKIFFLWNIEFVLKKSDELAKKTFSIFMRYLMSKYIDGEIFNKELMKNRSITKIEIFSLKFEYSQAKMILS